MKRLAALVLGGCVMAPAVPAAAGWILDTDVGIVYETNIGLAQRAKDIRSDTGLTTSVSTGWAFPIGDASTFSLTGDVSGTGYAELHGLSNLTVGATPAFRTKFGLGAQAPWLRVWGSGTRLEYDDSVRDAWRYRLGAGIGKRFGERLDVRLDYAYEEYLADHARRVTPNRPGDVFDRHAHIYSARVDFLATEVLTLFTGYAWREGEVVSTTRPNREIIASSNAITRDRLFGRGFVAYKIDAVVHVMTFGMSFALGERMSLNFGYDRQIGLGRRDLNYTNNVFRGGFLFSY